MIKSVTVVNNVGDSLIMELSKPEVSGFAIRRITGLGPGKATINVTEVSTNDGGVYNSARKDPRPVTLALTFVGNQSIEDLRQKTYKYFPLKKNITLIFETENRRAAISGYVESNEPDIFSKEEGSDISILCPDPNFYSVDRTDNNSIAFYGIEPMFVFPFVNEYEIDGVQPTFEFGKIIRYSEKSLFYDGDSDIGLTITINTTGEASNILITRTNTGESMRILTSRITDLTGQAFGNADSIRICTVKGKKSVTLIRDGTEYNILNALGRDSAWFALTKGDNIFAFSAESGFSNISIFMEYDTAYEGI